MPILKDYQSFTGRHWETGSICNALDYQGVKAPHTGKAYSEAFLLGISGGIAFGYFTFHYKGYDPQLAILTRNTFDPLQTLLERLGIQQEVYQTDKAEKGLANLLSVLEEGKPAIVWADAFSMPYEAFQRNEAYWAMWPMVVYGHEGARAMIADRAGVPLEVPAEALETARARVKTEKFRVVAIEAPKEDKLVSAANMAIWQCIRLFTEAPPKGTRNNFGLSGYQHWAKMLTNTRNKQSWARFFPAGRSMLAALAGSGPLPGFADAVMAWGDGGGERARYADFLNEAAILLENDALSKAGELFRESHAAWKAVLEASMPDEVALLGEARGLVLKRGELFVQKGAEALDEIKAINGRLAELLDEAEAKFPLAEDELVRHRERMREAVLTIHDIEARAVESLKAAMS